jgi:hypothetical protein
MVVATKLLERRTYKDTRKQLNVIAASWLQFMIHDWVDHMEDTKQVQMDFINLKLQDILISLVFLTNIKFILTKQT